MASTELLSQSVGAVIKLFCGSFNCGKSLSVYSGFASEGARGGLDTDACKGCNIFERDARGMSHG
jgi:hypothetical protein